jgi:signal transduction histidine kinase/CheY-like chemotaxis protein
VRRQVTNEIRRGMMWGISRTNLLTRLLILVMVATLPAMIAMLYVQHSLREQGRERLADEALRQAELLKADIASVIGGAREVGLTISHIDVVREANPACRQFLEGLRRDLPRYAVMTVADEDSRVICSTDEDSGSLLDATTATRLREILAHGTFATGSYLPPTARHGAVLPFCLPFTLASGRRAVVSLGLSLEWLSAHLGSLKRPPDSIIGVADRDGISVGRFPDPGNSAGKPLSADILPFINATWRGNAIIRGDDGKERLLGFVPATEAPAHLFVGIGMNLPGMLSDLDRETMRGTLMIAIGALVSLLLALVAAQRFIRRPTALLLAAARRWSSGDLTARARLAESPQSEFGSLALAFNDMAAALDHQRKELQELNATLEARVAERTHDLSESRNLLQVEMAEREKSETSLRQAQKLQAVGQLAGGIAHDFNNLLTTIVGALDLMRGRLPPGNDKLLRLVDNALQSAERGGKLTGQLLAFSRRQSLFPEPSDLNVTVVALSNLLASTLGRAIRIQTDLVQDLWPAMVDPAQIEAAIINLAINARDAMPDGGVLTIATRNVTLGGGGDVDAGDYVAVRVTDTGTGMSPEIAARVVEPFFTTKQPGRGSGLGLSQVHGLATQSGGDLRLESKLGKGTTVTLLLPRAHVEPSSGRHDTASGRGHSDPSGRRIHLLVVDDDDDVRQMTGEMLAEGGYAVSLASGGEEALALLQRDDELGVMLVDYAMPGMNGVALIHAARHIRPGLRCLMVTGHAELAPGESLGVEDILRKPFTMATLHERVELLLATQPPLGAVTAGLTEVG